MKYIKGTLAMIMSMSIIMVGCAKKADQIAAKYVSPTMYSNYDCEQIKMEMMRLNNRKSELEVKQNKIYKNDMALGIIGIFFLWPLWFAIEGDGETAAELGTVKGSITGVEQASIEKKCGA